MLRYDYSWTEYALGSGATLMLSLLAVTSLALRYVTEPISCWTPAQFTGAHTDYVHHVCFQTTEFFQQPPRDLSVRPERQHTYHQWVPLTLGLSALLCLLPHVLWLSLRGLFWLDLHLLAQTLADNQRQNAAGRHVILRDSAVLLLSGLRGGNWLLTSAAAFRKLISFVVCLVQLVVLVALFRPQLNAGADERASGVDNSTDSLPLPEKFLCDFEIRQMSKTYHYSVPCVFPLAKVYSKGFTFLFYFFLLLALACVLDLITWACRLLVPFLRDVSLQRYLTAADPNWKNRCGPAGSSRFLATLGPDGRLLLAVVGDCCGALAAADLTYHFWLLFNETPQQGLLLPAGTANIPPGSNQPEPITSEGVPDTADGHRIEDSSAIPLLKLQNQKTEAVGFTPM